MSTILKKTWKVRTYTVNFADIKVYYTEIKCGHVCKIVPGKLRPRECIDVWELLKKHPTLEKILQNLLWVLLNLSVRKQFIAKILIITTDVISEKDRRVLEKWIRRLISRGNRFQVGSIKTIINSIDHNQIEKLIRTYNINIVIDITDATRIGMAGTTVIISTTSVYI